VLTDVRQVQAIAAVATASWDLADLRKEQLNDRDIGPILEEVETRQHPEFHHRLQPYVQNLLGPMEIPCCEEQHTRVSLGIC
jgi:hypothetical protein